MAASLAQKMAEKLGVNLVEETADMMVMMLDCSSEVPCICKPAGSSRLVKLATKAYQFAVMGQSTRESILQGNLYIDYFLFDMLFFLACIFAIC